MKRRDKTAKTGAMLLLCGIYLVGGQGCADQLLPPNPTSSEPARDVLVYLNELAVGMAPDEIDLGRSTIVAERDGGGEPTPGGIRIVIEQDRASEESIEP